MRVVNSRYESYTINIMRPSEWGNPFTHLGYGLGLNRVKTREEAITRFAELFYSEAYAEKRKRLLAFPCDAKLGCCCKPKACHGDIIAGYYNYHVWLKQGYSCNYCGEPNVTDDHLYRYHGEHAPTSSQR